MCEKSGEQTEARVLQRFVKTINSLHLICRMQHRTDKRRPPALTSLWYDEGLPCIDNVIIESFKAWSALWDTGIHKMLHLCICMSSHVWRVTCVRYLISPHLNRCLRMTGAVSLRWGRMTRSRAGGCAAAATSRPWQKKTAATRTAVPNPRQRSRRGEPAIWRPHSRHSQRWPRSSKCVLGLKWLFLLSVSLLNIFLINWLIRNIRKWKMPTVLQFPRAQNDVFKLLVFSNQ